MDYKQTNKERAAIALNAAKQIVVSAKTNGTDAVHGLHFTIKHTGKMKGIRSISTSVVLNEHCQKYRKIDGSICSKCYAAAMVESQYAKRDLPRTLAENKDILTRRLIPTAEMPKFGKKVPYFRFESFGDLNNVIQAANYIRMAKANPETQCVLFTKNPRLIQLAEELSGGRPANMNVVLSSIQMNRPVTAFRNWKPDIVFTIYDKEHIEKDGIVINCGARSCKTCHKCYDKRSHRSGKVEYINEKLK